MTAFHQMMPTYPMMDPNDDIMEDSIYATQEQAIEDIDIDLEFNDDPAKDEQMEEVDAYVGDRSFAATQPGFDQDDEMADDEQTNTFENTDEQSMSQRPFYGAVENSSAEVFMTEPSDADTLSATIGAMADDVLVDFDRDSKNVVAFDPSNDPHSTDLEAPLVQTLDKNLDIANSASRIEETIQRDSDTPTPSADHKPEHNQDSSLAQGVHSSDGTNDTDPQNTEVTAAPSAADGTQVDTKNWQEVHASKAQPEGAEQSTTEGLGESNEKLLAGDLTKNTAQSDLQHEEPKTSSTVIHESMDSANGNKPEKLSPVDTFSVHNAEGEEAQVEDGTQEEKDEHDDSLAEEHIDLAIMVEYDGQELSLFPPHSDEASDTYLLSDHGLLDQDLQSLIIACKPVLSTDLIADEELILNIPALGLEISESASEATTTSLAQLRDTYMHLSHNDGVEQPEPLRLELFTKQKVSAQLEKLLAFVEQGKGLTALIREPLDFAEDHFPETFEDFGEPSTEGAPNIVATGGDGLQQQEATTNPSENTSGAEIRDRSHHEGTPEEPEGYHDEFLDFRSPMRQPHDTPSKTSGFQKDQLQERSDQGPTHNEDFTTENDTTIKFGDFDEEHGEQHISTEDEQFFQQDSNLHVGEFDKHQEAHIKAAVPPPTNETNDQAPISGINSTKTKELPLSVILPGENDFITGDSAGTVDNFEKENALGRPSQELNATSFPQQQDDGFDFDDFLEDSDAAPGLELGDNQVNNTVKTDSHFPEASESLEASKPVTATQLQIDREFQKLPEQVEPEEDEIDFSDDELGNEPEAAATAMPAKAESLKRMRPLEEDVDALEASPNGTKKQRPD